MFVNKCLCVRRRLFRALSEAWALFICMYRFTSTINLHSTDYTYANISRKVVIYIDCITIKKSIRLYNVNPLRSAFYWLCARSYLNRIILNLKLWIDMTRPTPPCTPLIYLFNLLGYCFGRFVSDYDLTAVFIFKSKINETVFWCHYKIDFIARWVRNRMATGKSVDGNLSVCNEMLVFPSKCQTTFYIQIDISLSEKRKKLYPISCLKLLCHCCFSENTTERWMKPTTQFSARRLNSNAW